MVIFFVINLNIMFNSGQIILPLLHQSIFLTTGGNLHYCHQHNIMVFYGSANIGAKSALCA